MKLSKAQRQMLEAASQQSIWYRKKAEIRLINSRIVRQISHGKHVTLHSLERRGLLQFSHYENSVYTGPWETYRGFGEVHFTITDAGREAIQP